jgi:hypothetical protein
LAAKLAGVEARVKAALRHAEVIGADETGPRVAGRNQWVHVARTDCLAHDGYDARRGKPAVGAIGIPASFTGVCARDGWMA